MGPISWATLYLASKILGSVTGILASVFGVFKVINWIKTKFNSIDSNVVELKKSMDTHIGGLREDIKNQTTAITAALSEQRQDFRTFYTPTLLLMQRQASSYEPFETMPVRARKPVKRKIAPKKK